MRGGSKRRARGRTVSSVIPNWADTAALTPQPRDNEWSREQGLAEQFVVMHSGNVGHAQDLDTLVRATTLPARPRRPRGRDRRLRRAPRGARGAAERARSRQGPLPRVPAARVALRSRLRQPTSTSSGSRADSPATSCRAASTGPGRRPSGDRRGRGRERDGAARARGRLRHRRARRATRALAAGDPRLPRRRHDLAEMGRRAREYAEAEADRPCRRPLPRACSQELVGRVIAVEVVFWVALGALAWTHVGYPLAAAARCARAAAGAACEPTTSTPTVAVIVAAYNEESVIERRLENLLALDYPRRQARARRHLRCVERPHGRARRAVAGRAGGPQPARREGRGAEQRRPRDRAARSSPSPTRTRRGRPTRCASSSATSPTPTSPTSAAGSAPSAADGSNKEGVYWRYELAARADESRLDSVTGGNGSIYAVRREDYVEVDPRFGHDLSFPYLMVQRGRRAVYEPEAHAFEKPTPTNETEYRRKVRMFEHCWPIVLAGKMLRRLRRSTSRDRLAPAPALRQRRAASRPARHERRAPRAAGGSTPSRSASSSALLARRARRRRHRALLRARDLGDGRRALELPAPRRARDVGRRGGTR